MSSSETLPVTVEPCYRNCPFSLSCLSGRPIEAHLYRCPHCGSVWYRSSSHSYRCDGDPRPVTGEQYVTWVCWDCVGKEMESEIQDRLRRRAHERQVG